MKNFKVSSYKEVKKLAIDREEWRKFYRQEPDFKV